MLVQRVYTGFGETGISILKIISDYKFLSSTFLPVGHRLWRVYSLDEFRQTAMVVLFVQFRRQWSYFKGGTYYNQIHKRKVRLFHFLLSGSGVKYLFQVD
jgi:hypothetical protein